MKKKKKQKKVRAWAIFRDGSMYHISTIVQPKSEVLRNWGIRKGSKAVVRRVTITWEDSK